MVLREIAFYLFTALTALSALYVVATQRVVHSALALAAALVGAAGLFILLGAEFVGLSQILIYVGAVVILFMFGIMLTSPLTFEGVDNKQRPFAALVALGTFIILAIGIVGAYGSQRIEFKVAFPTKDIGNQLFTTWILPFEAVSVLLLAALVGAIVLARRD